MRLGVLVMSRWAHVSEVSHVPSVCHTSRVSPPVPNHLSRSYYRCLHHLEQQAQPARKSPSPQLLPPMGSSEHPVKSCISLPAYAMQAMFDIGSSSQAIKSRPFR